MTLVAESAIILAVFCIFMGWHILKLAYEDDWPLN